MAFRLRLGTSSWTGDGWVGPFYPAGTKPGAFLGHYASRYDTVEIDATWYAIPAARTVEGWAGKTPEGFLFAAKVPKTITHEKVLVDCAGDVEAFLASIGRLGQKLGPLLLQFPYFNKKAFASPEPFLERLDAFLGSVPPGPRWAVEVRNKQWVSEELLDLLRRRRAAFTLIDQAWMPPPWELARRFDLVTTDFLYVRWMGDRQGIEEKTTTWDKVVLDRSEALTTWADLIGRLLERTDIYAYANNHYEGHAPATIDRFAAMIGKGTPPSGLLPF